MRLIERLLNDRDRIASVWLFPAGLIVLPVGLASDLDVLGWIGTTGGVLIAFAAHDAMRQVHDELDEDAETETEF